MANHCAMWVVVSMDGWRERLTDRQKKTQTENSFIHIAITVLNEATNSDNVNWMMRLE